MESLLTIPPKAKKADRSGPFQSHIKILVKSLRPLEHDGQKSVQIISRVASRSEIVIPLLSCTKRFRYSGFVPARHTEPKIPTIGSM